MFAFARHALLGVALLGAGCKRSSPAPAPQQAASAKTPDPDPGRFAAQVASFGERWKGADATLPDCAPLLERESERESCAATRRAATALRAALTRGAEASELIGLSGAAALSAQRASQLLRKSGVARLFREQKNQLAPSASGAAHPPQPVAPTAKPSSVKSLPSALSRNQSNPDLDAITAYARIATLGLRQLAAYLEFAPRELRESALAEVERLAHEEPHWAALRAVIDEAFLVEPDPTLKQRLKRLREQLG